MTRTILFLFAVLLGLPFLSIGQEKTSIKISSFNEIPDKVAELSLKVNETSGVIYFDDAIWTFNDSGGKPELYKIDKNGEVERTVEIKNAENRDWEDIAMDEEFIYIGDFGNNWGNRKDLTIYKVLQEDIIKMNNSVNAELIKFEYSDQVSFEIKNRAHNFDCESIVCVDNNLVLFSKNWGDDQSRIYRMPKDPGTYQLIPEDSFNANGLVTGADYNTKTRILALVGYSYKVPFIYIFKDFDLKNGRRIDFPKMAKSQTEGICWIDDNTLIISSEETKTYVPALFKINLQELISENE